VGPTADGEIPELQRKVLRGIGDWMKVNSESIYGTTALKEECEKTETWTRWTNKGSSSYLFIEQENNKSSYTVSIPDSIKGVSGKVLGSNQPIAPSQSNSSHIEISPSQVAGPVVIEFKR
jgi:alpha-L-fucosidase